MVKRFLTLLVPSAALGLVLGSIGGNAFEIQNWWPDSANIVMDEVFLPADTWSSPAQFQMSEWNEVDTTNNSHAFRVNLNPQFSFGANDGDSTIGFLGETGINAQYGLSYANALAWAVCYRGVLSPRYDECDVMLDPSLAWSLNPHNSRWFQSTVLHELGHVRGLGHENDLLSIENSGTSKYLRNEILYMDDKVGVRQNASSVSERDIVMYNKWHDGTLPRWMTMSPTTLREGDTIQLNNMYVENRGTLPFDSAVRFGIYLSTNKVISIADDRLNTGTFSSFGTYSFATFDWSAQIPSVGDCTTRYIGGIIDDNNAWTERFENNNAVTFTNGVAFTGGIFTPTALSILLAEDSLEPNDTIGSATGIGLPLFNNNLNIDTDLENDFYVFTITKQGTLNINVMFSHSAGDLDLFLLNSSGGVIETSQSVTDNETIVDNLAAGTYYVRVAGFGAGSCNRYSLAIDFAPVDPELRVTSSQAFKSRGRAGGPFSPSRKTYRLTNTGDGLLSWRTSDNKKWIVVRPKSGVLGAGRSTSVAVSLKRRAVNKLRARKRMYVGTALFTNATNNKGNTRRTVKLKVKGRASRDRMAAGPARLPSGAPTDSDAMAAGRGSGPVRPEWISP